MLGTVKGKYLTFFNKCQGKKSTVETIDEKFEGLINQMHSGTIKQILSRNKTKENYEIVGEV